MGGRTESVECGDSLRRFGTTVRVVSWYWVLGFGCWATGGLGSWGAEGARLRAPFAALLTTDYRLPTTDRAPRKAREGGER
jgi:hypothetical protein